MLSILPILILFTLKFDSKSKAVKPVISSIVLFFKLNNLMIKTFFQLKSVFFSFLIKFKKKGKHISSSTRKKKYII